MVFSNNLLFGAAAAASSGAAPFDPTLIGNSVWLNGSDTFFKRDNFALSADGRKEFIFSMWIQRNEFGRAQTQFDIYPTGSTSYNDGSRFIFEADDQLQFSVGAGGSSGGQKVSSAMYRDIGWYHVLISYNTNAAIAAASRHRTFVNGLEITDIGTYTAPPDNQSCIGSGTGNADLRIGKTEHPGIPYVPNAYYAQACYLEGKSFQAGDYAITDFLDSFTFGTNGSQYVPKADADIAALATTVGGNSFCLDFADSSDLGNDISSNANDFTPTSMDSDNQTTSSPSSAFATWNPLRVNTQTQTFAEGNLRFSSTQTSTNPAATGNYGVSSGKFYWEVFVVAQGNTSNMLGICDVAAGLEADTSALYTSALMYSYEFAGTKRNNNSSSSYGDSITTGDIVGVALDMDNGGVYFSKNGTFQASGDPTSGASLTNAAFTGLNSAGSGVFQPYYLAYSSGDGVANFGQSATFNGQTTAGGNTDANGRGNFKYSVPSGYTALTSANITAPTYQGIDYFAPTLYEGNGTGQRVGDFVPFTDAFDVAKSAMFDSSDLRYLARTPSSGGNEKTLTFSTWIKMTGVGNSNENAVLTTDDGSKEAQIRITGASLAAKKVQANLYNGSSFVLNISTDRTFGDTSSWNHLVVAYDTRAAVASANKVIIYINGVRQSVSGTDLATDDYDTEFNSTNEHNIGRQTNNAIGEPDFYLAETVMIDGSQLDPTSFGQLDTSTNRWVPKDVSGLTFGTNGFYLQYGSTFASGSGAGTDTSGKSNNWTESTDGGSAWATTDQFTDTPSANFATWDSGRKDGNTLSEGNLKLTGDSGGDFDSVLGTLFVSSGKYYWEIERDSDTGGSDRFRAGVALTSYPTTTSMDGRTDAWGISENGQRLGGGLSLTNYGDATTTGDFIGVALDMDRNAIYFSKNGTWMNSASASGIADGTDYSKAAFSNVIGNVTPFVQTYDTQVATLRTASGRWEGTAPTGFLELNQDNLDDTASKITALAWIKNRDAADDNIWMDRVIGTGGYLSTTQNDSGTAATAYGDGGSDILTTNANAVQKFLQRGVQIGSDENVNTANESYVLWQWLLGDSATTGSSITTGSPSLATTGIVSDANHFSIVQYTGNGTDNATFAHGLGSTPNFVMIKRISGAALNTDWLIHVQGLGLVAENYIYPHYRIAMSNGVGVVPDANLVELGTGVAINNSGQTHMAYSFKNTPGLCKIGTYTGNSSANGAYVSTGFRPSWLWIFNTTLTSADAERPIIDTARYRFNGATTAGGINGGINFSDQRAAEEAQTTSLGVNPAIDILSDGFKLRANDSTINTGTTYMYICMADIGGNGTLPPVYGR